MSDANENLKVHFGSIQFFLGRDAIDERRETSHSGPSLTVQNITSAQPAIPDSFAVSFMIDFTAQAPQTARNILTWTARLPVPEDPEPRARSYLSIETDGFAVLVGQIRELADALEAQLQDQKAAAELDASAPTAPD